MRRIPVSFQSCLHTTDFANLSSGLMLRQKKKRQKKSSNGSSVANMSRLFLMRVLPASPTPAQDWSHISAYIVRTQKSTRYRERLQLRPRSPSRESIPPHLYSWDSHATKKGARRL